jgi:hypothetical protein
MTISRSERSLPPTREERLTNELHLAVLRLRCEVEELADEVESARTREASYAVLTFWAGAGLRDLSRAQERLADHLALQDQEDEVIPGSHLEPDLEEEDDRSEGVNQ